MSINGKVAVVTGSAQGIGRGIALRLAQDGADICLVDMQIEKLQGVAEEIRKLGRKACAFQCDVTNRSQVFAAVDYAEKELGGFDIIVNNAGIC
ncbi:MAG: SDR family NAD(P)-dependent oxidoreductase, partial [Desulfovibrio sp.]|nr:SDR family NAD(P)-dependent oxidoreductase [Desulfovibrio sp.]